MIARVEDPQPSEFYKDFFQKNTVAICVCTAQSGGYPDNQRRLGVFKLTGLQSEETCKCGTCSENGISQGMAIIRQLRQLEERTGRHIHELFDLICGTSTGGILAVALALKQFSLDECQEIYRSATTGAVKLSHLGGWEWLLCHHVELP